MIKVRVLLAALPLGVSAAVFAQSPVISNAWVRAMPPGQSMTAAYLQLHNSGTTALEILGVSSSLASASLHETRVEDGRSSMRAVAALSVPAGESIRMQPGGLHIMLMGLQRTPVEGDTVPVCLRTNRGEACTDATVRRGAPMVHPADNHSQHNH